MQAAYDSLHVNLLVMLFLAVRTLLEQVLSAKNKYGR